MQVTARKHEQHVLVHRLKWRYRASHLPGASLAARSLYCPPLLGLFVLQSNIGNVAGCRPCRLLQRVTLNHHVPHSLSASSLVCSRLCCWCKNRCGRARRDPLRYHPCFALPDQPIS